MRLILRLGVRKSTKILRNFGNSIGFRDQIRFLVYKAYAISIE